MSNKRQPKQVFERTIEVSTLALPKSAAECEEFNRAGREREEEADRQFVEMVLGDASDEMHRNFGSYVKRRGWIDGVKDGVSLETDAGRKKDPAAWLAMRVRRNASRLAHVVRSADPKTISALRIAYWSGSDFAEWSAQAQTLEGKGPKGNSRRLRVTELRELLLKHPALKNAALAERVSWYSEVNKKTWLNLCHEARSALKKSR